MAAYQVQRLGGVLILMEVEGMLDSCLVQAGNIVFSRARPHRPFDEGDMALLSQISLSLMSSNQAKDYPDVMSFAFWCRRAHMLSLREEYGSRAMVRLGRGVALHISPSNVPVNFAFSWAFSLLAGNANIVRLPSGFFPQVEILIHVIDECLKAIGDDRNVFVSYPSEGDITEVLSRRVDARIIWGGNATVEHIKKLSSKPRCVDVAFPDRYSIAFLDAKAISELDEYEFTRLVNDFYNDTYLMDQNACSSARVVFWMHQNLSAQHRFWNALRNKARVEYSLQDAIAVEKYVQLCKDAIEEIAQEHIDFDGYLDVVSFAIGGVPLDRLRGSGGFFYECSIEDPKEMLKVLDSKCQTITYFGVDPLLLRNLIIENGCSGVDRIVPVGKALDIGIVWDGYDLVETLSREIVIR